MAVVKMASFSDVSRSTHDLSRYRRARKIDRLVTMHTSIARGDVWCKYQIFPALPQGARPLTEEEEEDDDKKIQKLRMGSLLQRRHEGVYKLRRHCLSYR